MLLVQLLSLGLLAAANPLLDTREPNNGGKQCCSVSCYKTMVYGDSHNKGQFSSYCSSYLRTTATPCPATITKTAYSTKTSTTTVTSGQPTPTAKIVKVRHEERLQARHTSQCQAKTSSPTSVPVFAQKACNQKDLSAACSCLGVQPTTKTLAKSTITTTTTKCTETTKTVTVTPCNTTTTSTIITTSTGTTSVTSATVTTTTTILTTGTITTTLTSVATVPVSATLATATITITTAPSIITITTTADTSTITNIVTVTGTITQSVTSTVTNTQVRRDTNQIAESVVAREEDHPALPKLPDTFNLVARNDRSETCSVVTVISTSTVQTTTTYSATATITSSVTNIVSTVTTTTIVPGTTTSTITLTETDTAVIIPTATAISSVTDTVTATSTDSITLTVTSIVTETASCNNYRFVSTSGSRAGQFLQGGQPDQSAVSYGFVSFTDPTTADTFTLRSDGSIYDNNVYGWITNSDSIYYILQMTDNSRNVYGTAVNLVYCTIGNGDTSYPGAVGTLSCSSNGHPVTLSYCDSTSNDLVQTYMGATDGTCQSADLVAIPAC